MNNFIEDQQRFDVPPFELGRMACGINAIIEVLNLPTPKITVCGALEIATTVMQILDRQLYVPIDLGQISILIQNIIDEKCTAPGVAFNVMQVCARNYDHLKSTHQLI